MPLAESELLDDYITLSPLDNIKLHPRIVRVPLALCPQQVYSDGKIEPDVYKPRGLGHILNVQDSPLGSVHIHNESDEQDYHFCFTNRKSNFSRRSGPSSQFTRRHSQNWGLAAIIRFREECGIRETVTNKVHNYIYDTVSDFKDPQEVEELLHRPPALQT